MLPEMTIVIAAYNEQKRLPESLRKIGDYLAGQDFPVEIVVVDDGSTDGTAATVSSLGETMRGLRLISYPRNRGKGYALRAGVLASRGSLVLVSDADLSTPIEELETLRPLIDSGLHQIAIGSRALLLSEITQAQPGWRRVMGRVFNRVVKALVLKDFQDTQCGFKLFTGEAARLLFGAARIDRFAYDVEILTLAKKKGYRIAEVPVRWADAAGSRVRPVLDSLQMLADLLKIRIAAARQNQEAAPFQVRSPKYPGTPYPTLPAAKWHAPLTRGDQGSSAGLPDCSLVSGLEAADLRPSPAPSEGSGA